MKSRQNLKKSEVNRELLGGQSPGLLQELHLLTRNGSLNADARRKLKQVNHLVQLLFPALADVFDRFENPTLVDVGAGKSYLGFILYEIYFKNRTGGEIISVETRPELNQRSVERAQRLGFNRMKFAPEPISVFGDKMKDQRVHLVSALHACDTATDDALIFGIRSQADHIAVVPCCQAEVAELLKKEKSSSVQVLWDHGIHRREFGSHLTNVMRGLALESLGYQVTVTELVGWEHSLKNELILAKRVQQKNPKAEEKLKGLVRQMGVRPLIVRELFPEY